MLESSNLHNQKQKWCLYLYRICPFVEKTTKFIEECRIKFIYQSYQFFINVL